jgi:hypothetical protein
MSQSKPGAGFTFWEDVLAFGFELVKMAAVGIPLVLLIHLLTTGSWT